MWKAMRQSINNLVDDVSTKAGSLVDLVFSGNTTGQSSRSSLTLPTLAVVGAGIISAGLSAGSIVISATAGAAAANSISAYAIGNTTAVSSSSVIPGSALSLSGAGGISVGYGAGGQLVISGPTTTPQSAQTIGFFALGNTTSSASSTVIDARSLSISGLGALSVGYSAGNVILSVPLQSNQSIGFFAVGNTASTSTSTLLDARTVSFRGAGIASVGYSAGSIIISASSLQSNQAGSMFVGGGPTTGATSTTYDARTLSFSGGPGANGISIGFAAGQVQIFGAGTVASWGAVSQTTGPSSSSTMNVQGVTVAGMGGVSVGYSNGSLIISGAAGGAGGGVAAAAGTQTATSGTVIWANSNGISFGMSGSSQITASYTVPAAQTDFTQKFFAPFIEAQATIGQHGNGQLHMHPLPEVPNFQFDRMVFDLTVNASTNTATAGSATLSMWAGFYTRNASTLSLLVSSSTSLVMSQSNNTSSSVSYNGPRLMTLGWTTTISKQDLWLGIMSSSSTSSAARFGVSQYLVNDLTDGMSGLLGQSSNSTVQEALGMGYYSTTSGALPGSIAFSQIFVGGSTRANLPPFYRFISQTA